MTIAEALKEGKELHQVEVSEDKLHSLSWKTAYCDATNSTHHYSKSDV